MASPQTENGFLRIAKEIIEKGLMQVNLSSYQQRILWGLWLKTWGWGKVSDQISISQFQEMTGIKRRHVARTLFELERMNIITSEKKSTKTAFYSFQKDYEKWLLPVKVTAETKQLLPNEGRTITCKGNKTITCIGAYKRKEKSYKRNIVQKLSDKVSLSAYLYKISAYKSMSTTAQQLITSFIDKARLARKLKSISSTVVSKIIAELAAISQKYGEQNLIAGVNAVIEKPDFNFCSKNITGYVRAVAKSQFAKTAQQQAEQAAAAEKEKLRAAGGGRIYEKLMFDFNRRQ